MSKKSKSSGNHSLHGGLHSRAASANDKSRSLPAENINATLREGVAVGDSQRGQDYDKSPLK